MKEWTDLPAIEKTYARATQIFEDRTRALEDFETTSGAKKNAFANQVTEEKLNQIIEATIARKDEEHINAVAAMSQKHEDKFKLAIMAMNKLTEKVLDMERKYEHPRSRTPTRRSRRVIKEETDSESEAEEPPTPVRSPVKRTWTQKEKTKKVKKTTSGNTKEFKAGGNYKPGMQWSHDWSWELKREFKKAKYKWQSENGKAGDADRLKDLRATVARYEKKSRE